MTYQDVALMNNGLDSLTRALLQKKIMAQQKEERDATTAIAQQRTDLERQGMNQRNAMAQAELDQRKELAQNSEATRLQIAGEQTQQRRDEAEMLAKLQGDKVKQAEQNAISERVNKAMDWITSGVEKGVLSPDQAHQAARQTADALPPAQQAQFYATPLGAMLKAGTNPFQAKPTKPAVTAETTIGQDELGVGGVTYKGDAAAVEKLLSEHDAKNPPAAPTTGPEKSKGLLEKWFGGGGAATPTAKPNQVYTPKTRAEFDALPSGAQFVNPKDGKVRTKN